jgi:hypothetical protein
MKLCEFRPVNHNILCHCSLPSAGVERGVLMPANSRASRVLLFSVLFLFVAAVAPGQARQQPVDKSAQSASAPAAGAPSSEASKYVGAETCKTCHEEIYNGWEKTPHWKTTLNKEGGPSKQGCEGCHGPGAEHVEGGGDKTKIFVFEDHSRQETSARCLTCQWRRSRAGPFFRIRSLQQQRRLPRLPLTPSRQRKAAPAGPEHAAVMLRLPHLGQSGLRQTLSPPRQRRSSAM